VTGRSKQGNQQAKEEALKVSVSNIAVIRGFLEEPDFAYHLGHALEDLRERDPLRWMVVRHGIEAALQGWGAIRDYYLDQAP
jgi:hypothetical protein